MVTHFLYTKTIRRRYTDQQLGIKSDCIVANKPLAYRQSTLVNRWFCFVIRLHEICCSYFRRFAKNSCLRRPSHERRLFPGRTDPSTSLSISHRLVRCAALTRPFIDVPFFPTPPRPVASLCTVSNRIIRNMSRFQTREIKYSITTTNKFKFGVLRYASEEFLQYSIRTRFLDRNLIRLNAASRQAN